MTRPSKDDDQERIQDAITEKLGRLSRKLEDDSGRPPMVAYSHLMICSFIAATAIQKSRPDITDEQAADIGSELLAKLYQTTVETVAKHGGTTYLNSQTSN